MVFNKSIANLALRLANIFMSLAPERLDAAFQNTREIQLSKADRVVAMEMMHVKSFEEAYKLNPTSKFSHFKLEKGISNCCRTYHCPCFPCFAVKMRGGIGMLLFWRIQELYTIRNVLESGICVEIIIHKASRSGNESIDLALTN